MKAIPIVGPPLPGPTAGGPEYDDSLAYGLMVGRPDNTIATRPGAPPWTDRPSSIACMPRPPACARYGVKSLAVFDSMARGDDREGSDVDILVTFKGRATFGRFVDLKLDLEEMLGRPVDPGTPETLRPGMRAAVERDLIHVP